MQALWLNHAGEECDACLFKVNLAGGVNQAHGEDFSFEPLSLPVHSAGGMSFGAILVFFLSPKQALIC